MLLIVFPALLSEIEAVFLMLAGAMSTMVGYHYRKLHRQFRHPAVGFYFRY